MKKIYLVVGEVSGDFIGSELIKSIRKINKNVVFSGIVGEKMQKEGMKSLFDYKSLSILGFLGVLRNLKKLNYLVNKTVNDINEKKPDIVVFIDAQGFSKAVAKRLNNQEFKKILYVAPTVWAWKKNRIFKIKELFNGLLCLLPFEPKYFTKIGMKNVHFVGHPLLNNVDLAKKNEIKMNKNPTIAVLPGSRLSEIKRTLGIFLESIYCFNKNSKVKIIAVDKCRNTIIEEAKRFDLKYEIIDRGDIKEALKSADFALSKSGTVTLDVAISSTPMIMGYKISALNYWIIKLFIKVKYLTLINLLLNKEVIPEYVQNEFTVKNIVKAMRVLITGNKAEKQVKECNRALKMLKSSENEIESTSSPSDVAAKIILKIGLT